METTCLGIHIPNTALLHFSLSFHPQLGRRPGILDRPVDEGRLKYTEKIRATRIVYIWAHVHSPFYVSVFFRPNDKAVRPFDLRDSVETVETDRSRSRATKNLHHPQPWASQEARRVKTIVIDVKFRDSPESREHRAKVRVIPNLVSNNSRNVLCIDN